MNYDYIYNSEKQKQEVEVRLDEVIERPVKVLFEKENIVLIADRQGNAIFCNSEGNDIYREKAEANSFFGSIRILVQDEKISVRFPITEWIDHYPNCDGEYDRWTERIIDNIYIYCPVKSIC